MDLVILENTSISLREVDEMDPIRKLTYYYFILEKKKLENQTDKGKDIDTFSGSNLG